MKKITLLMCTAFLCIAPLIFAGGTKEAPKSEKLSTINVAVPALPDTLEPGQTITVAMYRVSYNIFNNLVEFDFKGNAGLMPALAESWKQVDGKTLEVKLRQGVKFHNGDEMTSKDVAFTFSDERLMGPKPAVGKTSAKGYWASFERVEVIDRYNVRFHTKEDDPVMVNRLTLPVYQIVNERAYREAKSFEEWSFKPVGTGPYKVKDLIPADQLVLDAHVDYWNGKPAVDTLIFRCVPETSARIAGLIAGDYPVIAEIPTDLIKTVEADKNLEVAGGPSASYLGIYLNMHKPYMDKKLRQAMSIAIDRELLNKTLFFGRTRVLNGMQEPGYHSMFVKEHPYPKYDLQKAKQLVKDSAYNGEPLVYHILNDYYANEVNVTQALQDMWRAAGINVQIEVKENWTQVNVTDANKVRIHDMRNSSFTDLYGDPSGGLWRVSLPTSTIQKDYNWKGPDIDEYNKMGTTLDTNIDQKARYNAFKRMLEIMDENPPIILLYQNIAISAKRKNIDWTAYRQSYMYFGPENFRQ